MGWSAPFHSHGLEGHNELLYRQTEQIMTDIRRVGIDLAKKIFHLTAVGEDGEVVERKRFRSIIEGTAARTLCRQERV